MDRGKLAKNLVLSIKTMSLLETSLYEWTFELGEWNREVLEALKVFFLLCVNTSYSDTFTSTFLLSFLFYIIVENDVR